MPKSYELMMSSLPLEIIIADTHPLYLEALRSRLEKWFPNILITAVESIAGILHQQSDESSQLIITEIQLSDGDAYDLLQRWPGNSTVRFLFLSQYKDPKVVRKLCKGGALGYIHKSTRAEEILEAIRDVLTDKVHLGRGISLNGYTDVEVNDKFKDFFHLKYELTPREIEVLAQIKRGLSNKEIAGELYISEQTVSVHRKNIMRKVGVNNAQKLLCITYEHELA